MVGPGRNLSRLGGSTNRKWGHIRRARGHDSRYLSRFGAYFEALNELRNSIKFSKKYNREEEIEYFSNFYKKINTLLKNRDDYLIKLDIEKSHENHQEVERLYKVVINISEELNDSDSMEMYQDELNEYLKKS